MSILLDAVARLAREAPPGPGVVAVSGGPDSVALLLALVHLPADFRPPKLVVAHLNHQLRGAFSDSDALFVENLASRLTSQGHPLVYREHQIPVADLARDEGANLENIGRELRYDWLIQVARSEGAGWVATGHTVDDQAETILFRLLRGTGLSGLRGIPAHRELAPGILLLRPLLSVRKSEVLEFLQSRGQSFCEDSSNADLSLTRNRLRHELLPLLARDFNPEVVSALIRLAEQAGEAQDLIEKQAADLLQKAELPRAGNLLIFNPERFSQTPPLLVRELFRLIWKREAWPEGAMTFHHWDQLALVAQGRKPTLDLPGSLHARHFRDVLQVGKK